MFAHCGSTADEDHDRPPDARTDVPDADIAPTSCPPEVRCDRNASCSVVAGNFVCSCDAGFEGNGRSCTGTARYGQTCTSGEQCVTNLCAGPPLGVCSIACERVAGSDCQRHATGGLCAQIGASDFGCVGSFSTGDDGEDYIFSGPSSIDDLEIAPNADVDLHQLEVPAGNYVVLVDPFHRALDVYVHLYDNNGVLLNTSDRMGGGGLEIIRFQVAAPMVFVVIGAVAGSGTYEVSLVAGT